MTAIEFRTAIREALDEELARDERVIFFGEDVAAAGGVFATTGGLVERYGPDRVFDTPISELALAGAAFGSAIGGLRPVVEIMFGDFLPLAMDSLVNQAAKYWYMSNEQAQRPARRALGGRRRRPLRRDPLADPDRWFHGVPGLKIVCPSTPGRRQGAAQGRDPRRQPRPLPRAQAPLRVKGEVDGPRVGDARRGRASCARAPT